MPEVLQDGLPVRGSRTQFDFSAWADGQAWKFVKGEDYESRTDTFRGNVRRWAKANGYEVECQPFPALDSSGRPLPLTSAEPVALGVKFEPRGAA